MAFLAWMKESFDSGDPILRSWALVHSYWTPFICCGLYVFFVKRLGPSLMRNKQAFDLRILMIIYNFSIVFAYTVCLLIMIYTFLTTDAYRCLCDPIVVVENHYTYTFSVLGWCIYVLKYVEFTDTVFFVLRKKLHLITNLHVIHHASLPIICWVLFRTETSGFQFIPAGINTFVHIIMYTYYGLAAMGPEVQKKLWWKEYLTLLQMAQFVVILVFTFFIVPLIGCKTGAHGFYLDIVFPSLFLSMFYNFYTKTYKQSSAIGVLHSKANGTNIVNGFHKQNGEISVNGFHKQNGEITVNGFHKQNGEITVNELQKRNGGITVNELQKQNGGITVNELQKHNGKITVNEFQKHNGAHPKHS